MTGRTAGGHRGGDEAAASFIMGMTGLLVFNLLLGPCAVVLASVALARRTRRSLLAGLGLGLGLADLVVLAAFKAMDHTLSWHIGF
ncbi:DUF4190 domain-containing protein [Streptomyces sp. NPDC018045]|uniref:DUF4190 domain-containing protein n=1 Tax=Streptomyces sp. NPDC018045 TaxID=3365037 RepID=UPI0037A37D23